MKPLKIHLNTKTESAIVFVISYMVFCLYGLLDIPDYWGDAYHNVYMSWLTSENNWIYTDYKGRHLVWLPLHTYITGGWMTLFESFTLETVHVFNRFVGSLSVVLVFIVSRKITSNRAAYFAAFVLTLTPYWILYSNLNMAEGLSALFLLAVFVAVVFNKAWILFLLTFVGFFTRYEFTFLVGVIGALILIRKQHLRQFWVILVGGILAVIAWSWWSYTHTGTPIAWILGKSSSLWDAKFNESTKSFFDAIKSLRKALPIIPLVLWGILKLKFRKDWKENPIIIYAVFILISHWIAILIGQLWFTSHLDPKYYIITIPIATIVAAYSFEKHLNAIFRIIAVLVVLISLIMIKGFYYQQFYLDPQREMGRYLGENKSQFEGENIWIDFPVAQIESNLTFGHFFTSEMVMPMNERANPNADEILIKNILKNDIEYVVTYYSSYSIATGYLPSLEHIDRFENLGFSWTPIYCYKFEVSTHNATDYETSIKTGKPYICLWRLESL